MKTGRDQYLQALASLRELTRTQAERVAGLLAKQGEVQAGQASRIAEDLLRRTRKNREQLGRLIEREVKRQLGAVGIATRAEVARLQQRVRALEQAAERAGRPAGARTRAASSRTRTTRASSRPPGGTRRGARHDRGHRHGHWRRDRVHRHPSNDAGGAPAAPSPVHTRAHRQQLDVARRPLQPGQLPSVINAACSAVSQPAT